MSRSKVKKIGVTFGDPNGIGPEIIAKVMNRRSIRLKTDFVIIGDKEIYKNSGGKFYSNIEFVHVPALDPGKWKPGFNTPEAGAASLAYLNKSAELLKNKDIAAVVTAPVSKEAICFIQKNFTGHTEFYAEQFGVKHVEMMFVAGNIRMIILTRHIQLKDVPGQVTSDAVARTLRMAREAMQKMYYIKHPRIAICGLNPHAGEGGKMGKEEIENMLPAIEIAKKTGIDVKGPLPADTVFIKGLEKRFDIIIAMYHDQGLAPVKALCFDKLVNVTVGLPIIRTSPAHGTAFNLAGQNKANPSSMAEAVCTAIELVSKVKR